MESETLGEAVASLGTQELEGRFERHQSLRQRGLEGSLRGGRWGAPGAFAVLYLGRPRESVVAEAYRHLVDGRPGMRPEMVAPRRLIKVEVRIEKVLDLRSAGALGALGLDRDVVSGPHEACQEIAAAAFDAGCGALIANSASGLGETLAVFTARRAEIEALGEETWEGLPPDPRR